MTPILALAGFDEILIEYQIRAGIILLCSIPVIVALGFFTKWRIVGFIGAIVLLSAGLLSEPQHLLMAQEFPDPDMTHYAAQFRTVSWWWLAGVAVGGPAFGWLIWRGPQMRKRRNATPNHASDATSEPALGADSSAHQG